MLNFNLIKKKIKSTKAVKKITNTMQLIASIKLNTCKNNFFATSNFCHEYYELFYHLIKDTKNLQFLCPKKKQNKSKLFILITSNLGLCGPHNNNVCQLLLNNINDEDKIIVFGQKGINFLKIKAREKQILKNIKWSNKDEYLTLLPLSYSLISQYFNGDYTEIKIIYTKFFSSYKQEAKILNILPITTELFDHPEKNENKNQYCFEPNSQEIIKDNLPIYVCNLLFGALIEATLCEFSSRKLSMEEATKNADDLINDLQNQYNQIRQEKITQEINEIISGLNNEN